MHAIILKIVGYQVNVIERNAPKALESEAAGIRAGPELHGFLEQYVRPLAEYSITAQMVEIMDREGNVVQTLPPQNALRLTTWKIVYEILKDALLDTSNGQKAATYQTGQLVQDVEEAGKKIKVKVLNQEAGTSEWMESDLVVASDGAHSSLRRKLCPDMKPQYAGYVTWRGRVPENAVSIRTREALKDRCVILRVEGGYQISFVDPGSFARQDSD
jgi:2-polyprenyl-6-methoxyphenol hydroxylase-like FAD-dependent oxidoreductase